ncbi:HEAT repeat domain-containing protein [Actinomadura nitritigenes]|nr:HEAT repeat domain-containing protein [Actinomadura nitritigenes]
MDEPLAGLDDIDWSGLRHAYGSADDVPGLLRTLRTPDQEERQEALHTLYASIYHQGSRYPASGPAVPFLLALAADPATPDRDDPLCLAAGMAIGSDEAHLPCGVDIAGWRREVARLRASDPAEEEHRLDAWVAEAELAAYDAVRARLPLVRDLLADEDVPVRAAAAYTLGWFPEEAAASLSALRALLRTEQDPAVAANALISTGLLDGRDLIPRLREHLDGAEPLTRWAAAIALLRLDVTDPPVIAELAAASADPPGATVAFMNGDLRLYSAAAIAGMADPPDEAVGAVLDGLARTSDDASFPMAAVALRLAFRAPSAPLPPYADLTAVQRRTVQVIAELPESSWRWGNLMEILQEWDLPTDRDECRAYAGLA